MFDPDPEKRPDRPSASRIAIWVAVAGVGLYFVISGVVGLLSGGGS